MPLGIRAIVDFACKKIFGSPENSLVLFGLDAQANHHFLLTDAASGRVLDDAIEIHTIELPMYNLDEATIMTANKLTQWVFLLLRGQEFDAE